MLRFQGYITTLSNYQCYTVMSPCECCVMLRFQGYITTLINYQCYTVMSPCECCVMSRFQGYITTLTDRLRSSRGDKWSLSCRITDGTDTMEVVIAEKVKKKKRNRREKLQSREKLFGFYIFSPDFVFLLVFQKCDDWKWGQMDKYVSVLLCI